MYSQQSNQSTAWRAGSQQPSGIGTAQSAAQSQQSTSNKKYQPVGFVQSFYQKDQPNFVSTLNTQTQFSAPQSFHAANYQGNVQGKQWGSSSAANVAQNQKSIANQSSQASSTQSFGAAQRTGQTQQFTTPQSFHNANYRGGHTQQWGQTQGRQTTH